MGKHETGAAEWKLGGKILGIRRKIVDTGERLAKFCAEDLQNHYYKYLMLCQAKKIIGDRTYHVDKAFERASIQWWRARTGLTINPIWHNYYSAVNGIRTVEYLPENLYYARIEPFYNRKSFARCCDDKCYYTERFPAAVLTGLGAVRPPVLLRNISGLFYDADFRMFSRREAAQMLAGMDRGYVVKESITGAGGNRITFVEPGELRSTEELEALLARYGSDFVVEGLIEQCGELAELNPSSVNTIRLMTWLMPKSVHILSGVLRMGGSGSRTDNFSTGGVACGISEDGRLKDAAYDRHYIRHTIHPNGRHFAGATVPSYMGARRLVQELHPRFGHFRLISWDIAIDREYRPVLIEFNLTPQSIDLHQLTNGPLFGDLTEEMLKEVFHP